MADFDGRVALVTGAAGDGIGQATARMLAGKGATVVVTDSHERRTRAVTEAMRRDHGTRVHGWPLDVGNREQIDKVTAAVAADVGTVEILVNNAAVNVQGSIFDYDPEDWDRGIAVNLTGCWYLSRALMPGMRDLGRGAIINVSSVAADLGGYGVEGPYAVSKGGLHALTRSCAHDGGPYGIRCNAVTMGVVRGTRFVDSRPDLLERTLQATPMRAHPESVDIAAAICFLASDEARYITGEILNVAAGWYMRA